MSPTVKNPEGAGKPPSMKRRLAAIIFPTLVFGFLFPVSFFLVPHFYLDPWLRLPPILPPILRAILGAALVVLGSVFALWATLAQLRAGKGTPMPLIATQKLVVQKPYSYCRNPIYLGVIALFMGISVLLGSTSSLVIVSLFAALLLLFTKLVEEKELIQRYGSEYIAYKETTPFLVPRPAFLKRNKR